MIRPTVAQAKNRMRRTVEEILDPRPRSIEPLWQFFDESCAYCGRRLSRDSREAHIDHAVSGGGNQLGNLVLACRICNGDEKRDESWRDFLHRKIDDPDILAARQARIEAWLASNLCVPVPSSPDIERVRSDLERIIHEFELGCAELKAAVAAERAGGS